MVPRRVNGWERWARVAVLVGFLGVEISACSLASEGTGAADAGGSTDGSADGGDASSACDEEASACVDGQLTVCAAGRWQASVTCPSGCAEDGSASCKAFVPSHVGSMDEVPMGPAVWNIESGTVTLNAETGEIKDGEDNVLRSVDDPDSDIGYSLVLQNSGPSLGVFVVRSLHVAAEATLRAEGSAAVVIVATERIEIDGTLDVSADGSDSGPGGGEHGNGADGVYSQIIGGYTHGAGGGGSNAGKGGQGGAHEAATGTGAGGLGGVVTAGDDVLQGGGDGGDGFVGQAAPPNQVRTHGGGGGGAIQLTAYGSIAIGKMGIVRAHGSGGESSPNGAGGDAWSGSGAGAGAGGTVWVEALSVTVEGRVVANGGGGGGGRTIQAGTPEPGQAGSDDATAAKGGGAGPASPYGGYAGTGGDGAAGETVNAKNGTTASGLGVGGGGGGGGGAGRIVIRAATNPTIGGDAILSPSADPAYQAGSLSGD